MTENDIEPLPTTAPCTGPCHGTPGCAEAPGWGSEHRFKDPEDRTGEGMLGEYSGLDYMTLHNRYVVLKHGRYQTEVPGRPALCREPSALDEAIAGGAAAITLYDPWERCNRKDLSRAFCGRPFAAWLDAAYRGEANIHLAGGRLVCTGRDACTVEQTLATLGSGIDDLFLGSNGDDFFEGSGGNDTLKGGGDIDGLFGHEGDDVLEGDLGDDELRGGPGTPAPSATTGRCATSAGRARSTRGEPSRGSGFTGRGSGFTGRGS